MSWRRRKWLVGTALIAIAVVLAFAYAQVALAAESIRFDLKKIGESVYEARQKNGRWPMQLSDLEGTSYLSMPGRKDLLESGAYIIVWPVDFEVDPASNREHILAFDHGSLLARFGHVLACTGDLRIEQLSAEKVSTLTTAR